MHLHAVVYPAGLQLLQPVCQLTVELGHGCRWRDGVRGVPAVREKDAEGRDDQDSDQAHHDYERKNDPAARREGGEQRLSGGNDGLGRCHGGSGCCFGSYSRCLGRGADSLGGVPGEVCGGPHGSGGGSCRPLRRFSRLTRRLDGPPGGVLRGLYRAARRVRNSL